MGGSGRHLYGQLLSAAFELEQCVGQTSRTPGDAGARRVGLILPGSRDGCFTFLTFRPRRSMLRINDK